MTKMNVAFKHPDEQEFEQVKQMVDEFWLVNENMQPEQFQVISDNGKVIAFARLKEKEDATELGTLGVDIAFRRKGWGSKMVVHLLGLAKRDVYVVTTLFEFNARLGFKLVDEYPESVRKNLEACRKDYYVPEPYFVMKWTLPI
jgi:N-acetylglutamate synthase-like GNAT family acetyltransferase